MAATLGISTGRPLSFSSENCLFSSKTNRSTSNHQQQQMSFLHRNPTGKSSTVVRAYAGTAGGVMERRKSAATSLYEVLRVKQNASPTEIKTAYRTLAKVYHPDAASESDGRDFIEIHNAYSTLSDPSSRAMYDLSLGCGGDVRSSFSYTGAAVSSRSRVYQTRRWETDQCW